MTSPGPWQQAPDYGYEVHYAALPVANEQVGGVYSFVPPEDPIAFYDTGSFGFGGEPQPGVVNTAVIEQYNLAYSGFMSSPASIVWSGPRFTPLHASLGADFVRRYQDTVEGGDVWVWRHAFAPYYREEHGTMQGRTARVPARFSNMVAPISAVPGAVNIEWEGGTWITFGDESFSEPPLAPILSAQLTYTCTDESVDGSRIDGLPPQNIASVIYELRSPPSGSISQLAGELVATPGRSVTKSADVTGWLVNEDGDFPVEARIAGLGNFSMVDAVKTNSGVAANGSWDLRVRYVCRPPRHRYIYQGIFGAPRDDGRRFIGA